MRSAPTLPPSITLAKSKPKHKCPVAGCRRDKGCRKAWCDGHNQMIWRFNHPVEAAFNTLRDHAKGRGIRFAIGKEFWAELCELTGYADGRGREVFSLTVDRIDGNGGYDPGNIRVVTRALNGRKGAYEQKLALRDGSRVDWLKKTFGDVEEAEREEIDRRRGYLDPEVLEKLEQRAAGLGSASRDERLMRLRELDVLEGDPF